MTREILAQALETEGASGGSQGYALPDTREVTFFVAAPGDLFPVERVVHVDLRDKVVMLENVKRERFVFAYEDILGIRLLAPTTNRERVPGFGR